MIFVSTGGRGDQPAITTAIEFFQAGINCVELSGGTYFSNTEKELYRISDKITFRLHNYFPPPKTPFVLNLASADDIIALRTIQYIEESIRLAKRLGQSTYSFHAGFRMDPRAEELGKQIKVRSMVSREKAVNLFRSRLLELAELGESEGVQLLIENNVFSLANRLTFKENPFLLTEPQEIADFMQEMPGNVRLLLDVAHLKVSAQSLGFCPFEALVTLKPFVGAYHLSDNDGNADTNDPFDENAWFWPGITPGLDYYSIEVYRTTPAVLKSLENLVRKKLADN